MKNKLALIGVGILSSMTPWFLNAQETDASATNQNQEQSTSQEGGDLQIIENPNNIEENLIDFTEFEERFKASGVFPESDPVRNKKFSELGIEDINPRTLQPKYHLTSDDFKLDNWIVRLNSSADTAVARNKSYAKKITLRKQAPVPAIRTQQNNSGEPSSKQSMAGTGAYVLGARIHFPHTPFNAHAIIRPPFEIPTYGPSGSLLSNKESGKKLGIISNVGKIKKISMDISGRNYRNGIAIRLKDNMDQVREYFMGYSYFPSWRRLTWNNPQYSHRIYSSETFRVPLYPRELPFIKFHSFVVYRPTGEAPGDFLIYFRKIDVWYDYQIAVDMLESLSIDDEASWNILKDKAKMLREKDDTIRANIIQTWLEETQIQGQTESKSDESTKTNPITNSDTQQQNMK